MLKLYKLEKDRQRETANKLATYLLQFFANDFYVDDKQLQEDFQEFKNSEAFETIVARFEEQEQVDIHVLLKSNRFKVCTQCQSIFIAYDLGNRQTLCRYNLYKKYTQNGKKMNKNERSICEMRGRAHSSLKYLHKQNR